MIIDADISDYSLEEGYETILEYHGSTNVDLPGGVYVHTVRENNGDVWHDITFQDEWGAQIGMSLFGDDAEKLIEILEPIVEEAEWSEQDED